MVFKTGAFQISPDMTPEQVANKRAMIAALLPKFGSAKYVGEGIGQLATGVVAGRQGRKLDEIESKGTAAANSLFERIFGTANSAQSPDMGPLTVLGMQPEAPPKPTGPEYPLGVDELPQAPTTPGGYSMGTEVKSYIPDEVKNGIFAGESGGDYNALFGFSNRPGGKFANTRLTDMTVDEALNFASPSGEYGQTVKGQIGRVATPMGAYQIVGTTLRAAKEGLGLTGNEKMTPELQDMLGGWIYENQGTGAWAGYRGPQASFTPAAGSAAPSGYGAAAPAPTSAPSIPINELYMALQNPWLSGEQKGLITSMIQEQQQASDPLYQLQLAQAQADLAKTNAPAAPPEELTTRMMLAEQAGLEQGTPEYQTYLLTGELPEQAGSNVPAGFATLDMQAQAAGYAPGTPEYQEFMRNGGASGTPAAFTALDLQARAAGYEPGTPEYQRFMASRGAYERSSDAAIGKAQGEDAALYESMTSKMPGLESVVDKLSAIADEATYTSTGQAANWIGKQLGFEPSEAAVARTKYIAMVDNQVLPMLRDTFGAAFTVAEGESLRATLGDPNKTPEEKKVVLEAFIEQKKRDVEALGRRVNGSETPAAPATGAAVPITSDAEYDALPSGTMFQGPDGKVRRKP